MESGSFKTIGGAAKDSYWLCRYLSEHLKDAEIEAYADFSRFGGGIKYAENDPDPYAYDVVLLNSIRDAKIIDMKIRRDRNLPFCIYTDRADVVNHYYKSPIKRVFSKGANLPIFKDPSLYERAINSAREKSSSRKISMLRDFLSKSYELNIFERMKGWLGCYIAISALQANNAALFFKGSNVKVEYLLRAPHPEFKPAGTEKSFKGAVYAGRLEESQKNVSFMLRGVRKLLDIDPSLSSAELLRISGDGPDRDMYVSMAKDLGISDNIKFLGFTDSDKLVHVYNNASFFVITSNWEGLGRSIIEAMACGLPILLNEKINPPISFEPNSELVENGKRGFVYKSGDLADFASKFRELYSNQKLASTMGMAAFEFVRKNMSIEKLYSSYMQIIESGAKRVQRSR
ncbi:MAG: glycosyltransferase family 4 protein [Candidatus Micrarchaeaceae archaeon]